MKNSKILFLLFLIVAITSCSTVKRMGNKDNSTTTALRPKLKTQPSFIEGIEVTPGSIVKSKQKPITTKENYKKDSVNTTTITPNNTSANTATFALQPLYAERLKVDVNFINNELLYSKIEEWWATKYCMGGSTKSCIDCSGFTSVIAKDVFKIELDRTAQQQYDNSLKISKDELVEGDLVFFHTRDYAQITHVGVYLINNKFVHASTSNGVMISDLNDSYWKSKYYASGRITKTN